MKKIFSLFAAILFAGSMMAAEGDKHDFSQSLSQLLNNNASIESINIDEQSYSVKEVIISWRYNKDIANAVTMEVSVDGTSWGTKNANQNTGTGYTTTSFTHDAATGAIQIDFTNNTGSGTGHGTFFVNKVTLVEGASAAPSYTITAQSNNETYGTVSLDGSVITGSPKAGCRYATPAYTLVSGTATVAQGTGDKIHKFTVTPESDCTIRINFEAIPTYTVSFSTGKGNPTVDPIEETIGGAGITLPEGVTPACSANGWSFAGWAAAAVESETTSAPTLFAANSTYHPTDDCTLYAVYKKTEGAVFDGTTGGDFYVYATVSETKYYAKGFAKKLESTTNINEAVKFTFEKIVEDEITYFAIKSGTAYLSYKGSGTDFGFEGTEQYKWRPQAITGGWRLNAQTSGRAIILSTGAGNKFGPYAISNVDGATYFDNLGIEGGVTHYLSAPTCTPTAVDNTEVIGKAVKSIVNGQLVIEMNGVRYNAMGQIVK